MPAGLPVPIEQPASQSGALEPAADGPVRFGELLPARSVAGRAPGTQLAIGCGRPRAGVAVDGPSAPGATGSLRARHRLTLPDRPAVVIGRYSRYWSLSGRPRASRTAAPAAPKSVVASAKRSR